MASDDDADIAVAKENGGDDSSGSCDDCAVCWQRLCLRWCPCSGLCCDAARETEAEAVRGDPVVGDAEGGSGGGSDGGAWRKHTVW